MTDRLRRAGRGRLPDGSIVVWSVAEGQRGRRWRELRQHEDGTVLSTLLLETDREDRFAHTELATAAGLLTLHPETDGTLHGNSITIRGVQHLRGLPWADAAILLVEGSAVADAVAARTPGRRAFGVVVALDLVCRPLEAPWSGPAVPVDPRGVPVLVGGAEWPLEEDPETGASGPSGSGGGVGDSKEETRRLG